MRRILQFLGALRKKTHAEPDFPFLRDNPSLAKFDIGAYSYGNVQVYEWGEGKHLRIGKYCSFADGVRILLGGEHRADWITTYPFSAIFAGARQFSGHPKSKGDVVIGNDVWVAQGAIILSGVTIGNGAVVGARSVVTKSVPPYAIVAGNPAKIIRYRFNPESVSALERIQWWDWPIERIQQAWPLLLSDRIDEFEQRYVTAPLNS